LPELLVAATARLSGGAGAVEDTGGGADVHVPQPPRTPAVKLAGCARSLSRHSLMADQVLDEVGARGGVAVQAVAGVIVAAGGAGVFVVG
jgi:hypothetical protein